MGIMIYYINKKWEVHHTTNDLYLFRTKWFLANVLYYVDALYKR